FLPLLRHRARLHVYLHSSPTRRSSDLRRPDGVPCRRTTTRSRPAGRVCLSISSQFRLESRTLLGLGKSRGAPMALLRSLGMERVDRKSTRLNSSHVKISYAVFCLKKKN